MNYDFIDISFPTGSKESDPYNGRADQLPPKPVIRLAPALGFHGPSIVYPTSFS